MRMVVEAGLARGAEPGRADAIRQHAAQFDWDRAADGYEALYLQLLGLPAPDESASAGSEEPRRADHPTDVIDLTHNVHNAPIAQKD
jgi:hypothetical protein